MNKWIWISAISLAFGFIIGTAIGATCFTNFELSKTYTDTISAVNGVLQTLLAFIAILGAVRWRDQFIESKKIEIISSKNACQIKNRLKIDLEALNSAIKHITSITKDRIKSTTDFMIDQNIRTKTANRLIKNYQETLNILDNIHNLEDEVDDTSKIMNRNRVTLQLYLLLHYVDRSEIEMKDYQGPFPVISEDDLLAPINAALETISR